MFTEAAEEKYRKVRRCRTLAGFLKSIYAEDSAEFIRAVKIAFTMEDLIQGARGIDYLEALIRYVMNARQDIEFNDIYGAVKEISLEGSELIMTIAEQLIKEGMEKGMEKVAKQMFSDGEDINKIIKYTGLSREDIERLK